MQALYSQIQLPMDYPQPIADTFPGASRFRSANTFFNASRAILAKHQMETVGAELRKNMLWGNDTDPDTASN